MTATVATPRIPRRGDRTIGWLQAQLPKLVLSPSLAVIAVFVYGFIGWTIVLSFSKSKILPLYQFVAQTIRGLFQREPPVVQHEKIVG